MTKKEDKATVVSLRAHLKSQGCTCKPDIEIAGPSEVNVYHDDDCPLLTTLEDEGDKITFYPPGGGSN